MGNRTSTGSRLLQRRPTQYGSIDEAEDNNTSLNNRNTTQLEFYPEFYPRWKRRLALGSILICQLFNWVVFNTVTVWIPLSLQLNVYFFSDGAKQNKERYYRYMERVQLIPVVSLILLYASGWIAGIVMDSCVRKTRVLLFAQVIVTLGLGYQSGIILSFPNNVYCTNQAFNSTSISCHMKEFALCLSNHTTDGYCLDVYTGCTYIISIFSGVVLIGLPALGGDQIPDRDGVRQFYALFYWCQKAGEALSAVFCCVYLKIWNDRHFKVHDSPYSWLFYVWGGTIIAAGALSLLSILVVVCGRITRQVTPRFNMVKDTFLMVREAFRRRKQRREDESYCDLAKHSSGGSFVDRSVEDRVQLFKFAVIMTLLIPVGFAATLPTVPVIPSKNETQTAEETIEKAFAYSIATVSINMGQYITSIVTIPVIHKLWSLMARHNRPLTFLHKFIGGHVAMSASITIIIIIQNLKGHSEYSVRCLIAEMMLLGVTNAIIYTAGYELTFISASRAMQGSAMGIFYIMDGIANVFTLIILLCGNYDPEKDIYSLVAYNTINSCALGGMVIAVLLMILFEKKYNLGLSNN